MSEAELDRLHHIDAVCDRFEKEWHAGRRPEVKAPAGADPELIRELVRVNVAYRRRNGEQPTPDGYATVFPDVLDWGELFPQLVPEVVLVVVDPPAQWPLTGRTRVTVGRSAEADIPVRDPQ